MAKELSEILKYASQDVLDINQDILQNTPEGGDNKKRDRVKYGNLPTELDGRTFDSKSEARHYSTLMDLQARNLIQGLECQPKFLLLKSFIYKGKRVRAITYAADFKYYDLSDNLWHIVDVKSAPTAKNRAFINKWKMLQYALKDEDDTVLELVVY